MYTTPSLIVKGKGAAESKNFEIVVIDINDLAQHPTRNTNGVVMITDYVTKPGKYWTKIQVTSSKTSLPVTSEGEEDNVSISALPEFSIPGSTLTAEEFVQNYTNRSLVVGQEVGGCGGGSPFYRMFGSRCAPLSLIVEGQNNNDATMWLLKFQQFAKTDVLPGRYTGNFTFDTATTVAADATTVDVDNGSGEYQLTDNTVPTVITDLTNAVVGEVYTLLGSGGTNPATIEASNAKFFLSGAVDWQGLSGSRLTLEALDAGGGTFLFMEKSRV
ncbi:hypothetical protein [Lacinutrix sp. Hel_I_90]|uniref:hypothetical protein n=1 Tax=Lacinutrix sp. Hel_I_90 TaxID=1249999 RepID=UPI0005C9B883|nr:hypothetical protein [Lacinutrix sp. Hel_I_90]